MTEAYLLGMAIGFAGCTAITGVAALVIAMKCHSKVVGFENSTHNVQFVPAGPQFGEKEMSAFNKEQGELFEDAFGDDNVDVDDLDEAAAGM